MPPSILRLPITNTVTGGPYTVTVALGGNAAPARLLLDTGSSMFAVSRAVYDPAGDPGARHTHYLQIANYLASSFVGGVVQSQVAFAAGGTEGPVTLDGVNLAVTYESRPGIFDTADGIFGLAYKKLDSAWLMPADTWTNQYQANQVALGSACELDPCFDQLAQAGLVGRKFAFHVRRALRSAVPDDAVNAGLFILGGGEECTDLFVPPLIQVAVLDARYFNAGLLAVQVGSQPAITAPPVAPGSTATSNAMIDSGSTSLMLDQDLFDQVMQAFGTIDAGFPVALQQYAASAGNQAEIDLAAWPVLNFILQGAAGVPVTIAVRPQDYWQFDAAGSGQAKATLCGDGGMLGGQSILGLPLLCGYYVVFDRSAAGDPGTIGFARQA